MQTSDISGIVGKFVSRISLIKNVPFLNAYAKHIFVPNSLLSTVPAHISRHSTHFTAQRIFHGTAHISRHSAVFTAQRSFHGTAHISRHSAVFTLAAVEPEGYILPTYTFSSQCKKKNNTNSLHSELRVEFQRVEYLSKG
jgi:hypothetical protein